MAPVYVVRSAELSTSIAAEWARDGALFGATALATLGGFVALSSSSAVAMVDGLAYASAMSGLGAIVCGAGGALGEVFDRILRAGGSSSLAGVGVAVVSSLPLCLLEAGLLCEGPIGLCRTWPTLIALNAMIISLVLQAPARQVRKEGLRPIRLHPFVGGLTWAALALLSRELTALLNVFVH